MKILNADWLALLTAVFVSLTFFSSQSSAAPVYGASVLVQADGEVVAAFRDNGAGFVNDLFLESPPNALGLIFTNQTTPVGTTVSLGNFAAGTELIFRMHVNDTGDDFYTGPASRNSDSVIHAYLDDERFEDAIYVGFEDLNGGGDLNYLDLNFSVTNTEAGFVPEPATCVLCGLGIALLALPRRLRSRLPEQRF